MRVLWTKAKVLFRNFKILQKTSIDEGYMDFSRTIFEASFFKKDQLKESTCPEIVFSGRSNVGKSSLINKLANRKSLARVSSKPGKTGSINFYRVNDHLRLVDLPGYGYAKVSMQEKARWADLVEGYFNSGRKISLVVQIVDMRHSPTADDLSMINFLCSKGFPFIIVLTKSDKLSKTERENRFASLEADFPFDCFEDINFVIFSSVTGEGVAELGATIESAAKNN